jgi:hypothetical protein
MTDDQKLILPYVESCASSIISYKEKNCIEPLCVSDVELLYGIRENITECMRELCRQGKYKASISLNHPIIIKR